MGPEPIKWDAYKEAGVKELDVVADRAMRSHDAYIKMLCHDIPMVAAGLASFVRASQIASTTTTDRVGKRMAINQCYLTAFRLFEEAGVDVDELLNRTDTRRHGEATAKPDQAMGTGPLVESLAPSGSTYCEYPRDKGEIVLHVRSLRASFNLDNE